MAYFNDEKEEGFEGQEMETCECGVQTPYDPNDLTPTCSDCKKIKAEKAAAARVRKNQARRDRHAALTSLGLKRVRGAQGGVYYE